MRILGLHIGEDRIGGTLIQRQFGKTELVDSFSVPFASPEELAEIVKGRAAAWTGARIVSVIPGRLFTQRVVTFPFGDRKKIEKALPFEIEDLLPFELDASVLEHLALAAGDGKTQETSVLAAVLPKTALRTHLDRLAVLGIDPQVVVPSFAGLAAVARMLPAGARALLVSGRDLCVMQGGAATMLRSLGGSATAGVRHTLQAIETALGERIEKAVLLNADDAMTAALTEAGLACEQVAPALSGKQAADAASLGAALAGDVNFRKGEFAYKIADQGTRRKRGAIIAAAAVAAVLFSVNIGVKSTLVRSEYGTLDREIRGIFRQSFPDARESGDPVRQMRDKVADARKRIGVLGSGTSALDVLKTVNDDIPKEIRVSFQEFILEADRVRLQGEAPAFEAVDKIKAEFQKSPLFSDVTVQDTRMGVDSKVKFRMEIKLKQGT